MRRNVFSTPQPLISPNSVLMEYGITGALVVVVMVGVFQILFHFL
ncbi:MAG TPA: hypothetical protein VIJ62_10460 [Rhizomicrobium sp.]